MSLTLEERLSLTAVGLTPAGVGPRSGSGAAEPPAAEDPLDPPPPAWGSATRLSCSLIDCKYR